MGMDSDFRPDIEVTVALFTFLEAGRVSDALIDQGVISVGKNGSHGFGAGLFVLTTETGFPGTPDSRDSGKPWLPTSSVRGDETLEAAARRFIHEGLGIYAPVKLRQTGIFDDPDRNPYDRMIAVTFWGFVPFEEMSMVLGGRDRMRLELVSSVENLRKFGLDHNLEKYDGVSRFGLRVSPRFHPAHPKKFAKDLNNGESILAMDFDEMVFYSWRKMRYGFNGLVNPFNFLGARVLPDSFRISDLRQLHDVIRGEVSQADTFKRSVTGDSSYLEPMSETDTSRPGRPSLLYRVRGWEESSFNQGSSLDD